MVGSGLTQEVDADGSVAAVSFDSAAFLVLRQNRVTTSVAHSPGLIRWSLALSKFNIRIKHIEGKANHIADHLSRALY